MKGLRWGGGNRLEPMPKLEKGRRDACPTGRTVRPLAATQKKRKASKTMVLEAIQSRASRFSNHHRSRVKPTLKLSSGDGGEDREGKPKKESRKRRLSGLTTILVNKKQ